MGEITAGQEREYYDRHYAQFLTLPDHALRCTRATLLADLDNPARPIYERRRLYRAAMDVLLSLDPAGKRVLEYGCGTGDWGLMLAGEGAEATLLDLSPVAIEVCRRRAEASGVADRVRGVARDASDLSCFADGEFDLIFAGAALHHTLKYPNALEELARVTKQGGCVVLAETYGNNPLLNVARRLRWRLQGEAAEQGEDILIGERELDLLRRHFRRVEVRPMSLLAMAKRLFRGQFEHSAVRALVRTLEAADSLLLRVVPPLGRYCGEVLVIAER